AALRRKVALVVERRRGGAARGGQNDVRALLEQVRPTEREALLLRYVALLSVADLAAATGTDETATRRKISRGLSFLCRLTAEAPDSEAPSEAVAAERRRVEEALADVVDGLAPDSLTDFIAGDDPSRDLAHDAERVVSAIRDIEPADGFDLAALSARFAAAC